MELKQPHRDWLEARGIDPILAEKFGLHTKRQGDRNWLAVPYMENGKIVNHKYRVTSDKSAQMMDPGAPLTLWNHDALWDEALLNQPLIIAEGEWDALALLTVGKRRVVSVPNGAPKEQSDDQGLTEGARYAWFWRCQAALVAVKKVILCVDNDEAGKALAADLCRLFGPERCSFVEYPEHCKDANDVLLAYGPDKLVALVDAAKPYPVKGLYSIDDYPNPPSYTSHSTGLDQLDELFRIVPRTFTVCTGYAGQGKTTFLLWLIAGMIARGLHVTVASFETDIKPILERKLRAALLRKAEWHRHSPDALAFADKLIREHVAFISHSPNDDEDSLSIEDVIELAKASVIRHGTRVLIIDPWNEIDHKRGNNETETDYTGRAIRMVKRFAKQYDVAAWMIAHPSKPWVGQGQKRARRPGLYDISGSANWANKADYGIVFQIESREYWTTTIACTKVRMGLPGKIGETVIQFNPNTSSYSHYASAAPTEEAA